jgi:hypothetical protein
MTVAFGAAIDLGSTAVSAGASFLEQSPNDNCSFMPSTQCTGASFFTPTFINVSALQGDSLEIIGQGTICFFMGTTCVTGSPMVMGVFSTTNTLLSSSNLNRVTGAIQTGLPNVTTSTFFGPGGTSDPADPINTTIAQDFLIPTTLTGVTVTVPVNAQFLVVGIEDSFYSDNFGNVSVHLINLGAVAAVPEPGTFGVALAALAGLVAARKKLFRS